MLSHPLPRFSDQEAVAKRQKLSEEEYGADKLEPDENLSEEEEEYVVERQKLSLPPAKACVVASTLAVDGDTAYAVFISDLGSNTDDFISIAPTFRLETDNLLKDFCLLGSTLYIFDSTDRENDPPLTSVATIDLSNCDSRTPGFTKMERSQLGSIRDMNRPKVYPSSTPTPDGKILVRSSLIRFNPFQFRENTLVAGDGDFELYDPEADTWQNLPGIRYNWLSYYREHAYQRQVWIAGSTFIGKSTLVIQIVAVSDMPGLMFFLDLESIDQGWQEMNTFFGVRNVPFDNFCCLVVGDQLCVNPCGAYDPEKEHVPGEGFTVPWADYGDDIKFFGPSSAALLGDVNNGKFCFCSLDVGIGKETRYPHFVVSPFICDLTKYKDDKEKIGDRAQVSASITIGESFKFRVDGEKCTLFTPLRLFCFPSQH